VRLEFTQNQYLVIIPLALLILGGILYLGTVYLQPSPGNCQCVRYTAGSGMAFKYNVTNQDRMEQQILISFLGGGLDVSDLKSLSVRVNDETQAASLGIRPGSYIVVPGTPGTDHVVVIAHFKAGGDFKKDNDWRIVNTNCTTQASVVKNGENITITFSPFEYFTEDLTVLLNNVRQQSVHLTANGTYVILTGTAGSDHLEVFSEQEVSSNLSAIMAPKNYLIDTYV
jgi:hypothetical protein